MFNISPEHKKKLQMLIHNDDINSVVQGLEILETLTEDIDDIYYVFNFDTTSGPTSIDEMKSSIPQKQYQCHVILWLLCKMFELGVEWVRELESLDLSGEGLVVVPNVIGDLTNLKRLDLSYNKLTVVSESIGNLTNLTHLYLNHNRLSVLPDSIGNLTNTSLLHLHSNQLSTLPDSLSNLYQGIRIVDNKPIGGIDILVDEKLIPTLVFLKIDAYCRSGLKITSLCLRENKLHRLPESIGNLTSLTSLNLSLNRITNIPESIGNLIHLVELDISQNYRRFTLPDRIGNLQSLRTLNIRTNKVTEIPDTIKNLVNLEKLYIYDNKIQMLPNAICSLTNLEELAIYKNQITVLPDDIGRLTNIREISVYFNSLSPSELSRLHDLFGDRLKS